MLTAIADRLWTAEQPLRFLGLPIFSRMTVMALPNQDLIVISPITPTVQLTWIIHEESRKSRKESLKRNRIKLSRI